MREYRVINYETLVEIASKENNKYNTVILGHENCPNFYIQSDVDKMIQYALKNNLNVKVNIPVLFEDYLDFFKKEAERLLEMYQNVKLVLNDWGILSYLHKKYPEQKFCAGKGISFTYSDNPWNQHILMAEKEKYREALLAHNFENKETIDALKELGGDEVELSDLAQSYNAYKHLKEAGFIVSINKKLSVVTMSRACHCLRFINKVSEMGSCIEFCNTSIKISIKKYFDMMETELKSISEETKKMQPDMFFHGNILFLEVEKCMTDFTYIDNIIDDERLQIKEK